MHGVRCFKEKDRSQIRSRFTGPGTALILPGLKLPGSSWKICRGFVGPKHRLRSLLGASQTFSSVKLLPCVCSVQAMKLLPCFRHSVEVQTAFTFYL